MLDNHAEPLLVALFLGCGTSFLGLVGLINARGRSPSWIAGLLPPLSLLAIAIASSIWMRSGSLIAAGTIPSAIGFGVFVMQRWRETLAQWAVKIMQCSRVHAVIALTLAPISTAAGAYWYETATTAPDALDQVPRFDSFTYVRQVFAPGNITTHAFSDQNTPLTVYSPQHISPEAHAEVEKYEKHLVEGLKARLIRTAEIDESHNCHGWVFANGVGWLNSAEVSRILTDNNYEPVEKPEAGDVIVYYSGALLVHSGIVRHVEQRRVIIESKWSMCGRFIHTVEEQPYGTDYRFFRTGRPNHFVRYERTDGASLPGMSD